jgi:hypothetical protein
LVNMHRPTPSCQSNLISPALRPRNARRQRVRAQALLDQHRQADHALAHIGHPAGEVDTAARRQRNHRPSSAPSTRRSARPSTWASTRSDTPPGSTISISPCDRGGDGCLADGRAIGVRSGIGGGRSAPRRQSVAPAASWRRPRCTGSPFAAATCKVDPC